MQYVVNNNARGSSFLDALNMSGENNGEQVELI